MITLTVVNGKGRFKDGKRVLNWFELAYLILGTRQVNKRALYSFTGKREDDILELNFSKPHKVGLAWKEIYAFFRGLLKMEGTDDAELSFRIGYINTTVRRKFFFFKDERTNDAWVKVVNLSYGKKDKVVKNDLGIDITVGR